MRITLLFIVVFVSCTISYSQNNSLVLNDNAFIVLDDSVFVVINQPHENGIITTGTGGNIVSENEFNKIRWEIGTSIGNYVLPYITKPVSQGGNGVKIPFTIEIQAPGAGANGRIDFSTYETTTDMNVPWVSVVTHMNSASTGLDNSLNVVDRFWWVEANNYTVKPDPQLTISYDDSPNEIGILNTILEADLVAQRFNTDNNNWEGDFSNTVYFWGVADPVANVVNGIDVSVADYYATWVLVNKTMILPVELVSFQVECVNNRSVKINWSTASELDNDYFTIEKSEDGLNWTVLDLVDGAGTSTSPLFYSITDDSPFPITYYRIKQTDFNGVTTIYNSVQVQGCIEATDFMISTNINGGITVQINADKKTNYQINLFDNRGRKVSHPINVDVVKGSNIFNLYENFAPSTYLVSIENESTKYVQKVVIIK